ncbi:MAG: ABC transporter ATP-binding protein [Elusimicrobia bacterium]|nr:ABC transporter ATP-binding protein [Elusimicrobiota bacterium]
MYALQDVFKKRHPPYAHTLRPGEFFALKDVSVEVGDCQKLLILGGPSSGKTTLARLLTGQYRPDEGQVSVVGRVCFVGKGKMGMHPFMTLREYLELALALCHVPGRSLRSRVTEVADFYEFGPWLDARIQDVPPIVTKGLPQAAGSFGEGDIFVFDESVGIGSPAFEKCYQSRLAEIFREKTVLVLAGSAKKAPEAISQCRILHSGRLFWEGTREEGLGILPLLANASSSEPLSPGKERGPGVGLLDANAPTFYWVAWAAGSRRPLTQVIDRVCSSARPRPGWAVVV